jgi:hypothetical protein
MLSPNGICIVHMSAPGVLCDGCPKILLIYCRCHWHWWLINLYFRIYSQIFVNIRNGPYWEIRDMGKTYLLKTKKLKISCHTPFKFALVFLHRRQLKRGTSTGVRTWGSFTATRRATSWSVQYSLRNGNERKKILPFLGKQNEYKKEEAVTFCREIMF